ncbi:hypothetical protein CYMTET_32129 [Cymbomonas tetramitiformis]|uniref:Glutaredoxin domain-containing protein n=1 Tax=Cymbomonas tetramitiformis TaxID=36881 RepID=A0AAE0KSH7_9CHLO|nr:hypothetical protein CYMTET_32129 [Cymbomonas tetramitiformis]
MGNMCNYTGQNSVEISHTRSLQAKGDMAAFCTSGRATCPCTRRAYNRTYTINSHAGPAWASSPSIILLRCPQPQRQAACLHQAPRAGVEAEKFRRRGRRAAVVGAAGVAVAMAAGKGGAWTSPVQKVSEWLVAHPAPLFLVNNPVKAWLDTTFAGKYDEVEVAGELQRLIASADVVLFGYGWDPAFTARAKAELETAAIPYLAVNLESREDGAALRAELGRLTGRTSIPHIFIGGQSIGGCNDGTPGLRPLIASGELEARLDKCSADFRSKRARLMAARA